MFKLFMLAVITSCFVATAQAQTPPPTPPKPKDYTAHVVGYAHMDMAWLWRWEESIHDIMYKLCSPTDDLDHLLDRK